MGVIGADHTSFTVSNLDRSVAFYCDLLGFRLLRQRPEITNNYFRAIVGIPDAQVRDAWIEIPGTSHRLELFEYQHPRGTPQTLTPNNPGSSHLAYLVDDLQAMFPKLKAAGVEFISEPVYLDEGPNTGGWALYMKDPDGIVIELFQPAAKADG
jgi:catechol 2,3-dioxygenase-like lactoylglutathione lyase family enzyme